MAQAVQTVATPVKGGDANVVSGDWREAWGTGALIVIMLLTVTSSVALANWADGVGWTPYAAVAGFLFGALVSRLRLPGWLAHPLMLLEGTFVTALLMSNIVHPSFATWNEKVVIMETRLARWAGAVTSGGIGTDALLFAAGIRDARVGVSP